MMFMIMILMMNMMIMTIMIMILMILNLPQRLTSLLLAFSSNHLTIVAIIVLVIQSFKMSRIVASLGKSLGEHTNLQNEAFFGGDLYNLCEMSLSKLS